MELVSGVILTIIAAIGPLLESTALPSTSAGPIVGDCTTGKPPRSGLATAKSPELRKLAEYEQTCGGAFIGRQMIFTRLPEDLQDATRLGATTAETLKEFAAHDVAPLVIFEPLTKNEAAMSIKELRAGRYDRPLQQYFQELKKNGVTDTTMGTWVPLPEANAPVWHTTNAGDFTASVTKLIQIQKRYFPGSQASILLNSQTYPDNDEQWDHGKYSSLLPYVKAIPKGLVDSFGYQGFPWVSPAAAQPNYRLLDPAIYLRADLAIEAARELGVRTVWFNTGTFGRSYTQKPGQAVRLAAEDRQRILGEVLNQAKTVQSAGFQVAINIFSQDKTAWREDVDWSYWLPGQASTSETAPIFKNFVRKALTNDVDIWLFDSARD